MRTNRQNSFIATLALDAHHVNFLGQLHETPAIRLDGHCLSKDPSGFLGAFLPAGRDTTSFNLLNLDNRVITLSDLTRDTHLIRLKARSARHVGSLRRRGAPYLYLGETDKEGIVFKLRIIERNASFLNDPDEV